MTSAPVVFTIFCAGITSVVPDGIKPVSPAGLLEVHVKVVPGKSEVRLIALVCVLEQMVWAKSVFVMDGISFTEKVSETVDEPQPVIISKVTV